MIETRVGHGCGGSGAGVGQRQTRSGALLDWILVRVEVTAQTTNLVTKNPEQENCE